MTLKTRIIPCLDVKDGRVVKGVQFVDLVDAGDPVEAAIAYDAAGADELCFLDITASHENRETIFDVVARTAEHCFMPVTVGGGIRKIEDIRKLLLAGADKVSINTAAVNDPDFVARAADKFGDQCIVVSVDARRRQPPAPGQHHRDDPGEQGDAAGIESRPSREQRDPRHGVPGRLDPDHAERDGQAGGEHRQHETEGNEEEEAEEGDQGALSRRSSPRAPCARESGGARSRS